MIIMALLRKTRSVCPRCINEIDAEIIEEDNKVYMVKECKEHGLFKVLLSKDAGYYKELHKLFDRFKFKSDERYTRNYYNLYLTLRCNLDCTVCLTNANTNNKEPSISLIKEVVSKMKKTKIGLWGGEPTLREDLPEIIEIIRQSGNMPALYTNGIKIADYSYLKGLRDKGLDIVHLQFDGFDDNAYKILRSKPLLKIKLKALENLEQLKIPTVLEATFVKSLNEKEMINIIEFAAKKRFITAVLFRSYSYLGKKGFKEERQILGEELIDNLNQQTSGRITKQKVLLFQKLLYAVYNITATKRCFYNQYFMLYRDNDQWKTIDEIINLNKIDNIVDNYIEHNLFSRSMLLKQLINITTIGFMY